MRLDTGRNTEYIQESRILYIDEMIGRRLLRGEESGRIQGRSAPARFQGARSPLTEFEAALQVARTKPQPKCPQRSCGASTGVSEGGRAAQRGCRRCSSGKRRSIGTAHSVRMRADNVMRLFAAPAAPGLSARSRSRPCTLRVHFLRRPGRFALGARPAGSRCRRRLCRLDVCRFYMGTQTCPNN